MQDAAKPYVLLRRGTIWPKDWQPPAAPRMPPGGVWYCCRCTRTGGTKATFSQRDAREAMNAFELLGGVRGGVRPYVPG
ncbi:hypothetical protein, partial [Streptomyces sp. WAC00303]|uniref:hypothetical protein n=1 Tax=Streptomyces sp. WAC00303 TaxID=2933779 RepID=UPI00205713D2